MRDLWVNCFDINRLNSRGNFLIRAKESLAGDKPCRLSLNFTAGDSGGLFCNWKTKTKKEFELYTSGVS